LTDKYDSVRVATMEGVMTYLNRVFFYAFAFVLGMFISGWLR